MTAKTLKNELATDGHGYTRIKRKAGYQNPGPDPARAESHVIFNLPQVWAYDQEGIS
jgi:hypothetical protein